MNCIICKAIHAGIHVTSFSDIACDQFLSGFEPCAKHARWIATEQQYSFTLIAAQVIWCNHCSDRGCQSCEPTATYDEY